MIHEVFEETPQLADRCEDFSADRGLDSGETKALLFDQYGVKPVIDIRQLWKAEKDEPGYDPANPITRPLFPDRADTIVFTEKVLCIVFVQLLGSKGIWRFAVLKRIAIRSSIAVPLRLTGFPARGSKLAQPWHRDSLVSSVGLSE